MYTLIEAPEPDLETESESEEPESSLETRFPVPSLMGRKVSARGLQLSLVIWCAYVHAQRSRKVSANQHSDHSPKENTLEG